MVADVDAPGWPGISPTWTSSAKTGVGKAISAESRVSFTISHGILNEIYYPRIDEACIRDCGLIVTDGRAYLAEEKRDTLSLVEPLAEGVPGYRLVNRSRDGRFTIEKRVIADPRRDAVLQHIRFVPQAGARTDYRVFVLLAPHLVNAGQHNDAFVATLKGWRLPFASGRGVTLALAASRPYRAVSVGYVGTSDGFRILHDHFHLAEIYDRAKDGNVALCAELDLTEADDIVLAIGFGREMADAGIRARASLMDGYDRAEHVYVQQWLDWQKGLATLEPDHLSPAPGSGVAINPYRVSTAVLRTHEASPYGGGLIASLSIPWGFAKGDDDLGGYHLVWPRDLVESASALLAIGALAEARRVLTFLQATQEADGHWPQNMWLDGTPYWPGLQMDETAFPILLVDQAYWAGALSHEDLERFWPMVRHAARYLVLNGPVTGQDRWEEDGGYSPFTLAVEVAALVVAADLATRLGAPEDAAYLYETADLWNASIERWTFATDTPLARELGISGYYVRIASAEQSDAASPVGGFVAIKNRPPADMVQRADAVVSPDALALVRFGLRDPDDPRIRDTVRAIDHLLKVDLPQGSLWRRYNGDGYGEKEDGAAFDGVGIGRPWPLLAGERAHYELARGDVAAARRLLRTLEESANDGGLIPEQVWDGPDRPDRELVLGRPSGSAMPLVWAHSEHVKLLRSLKDGVVFDMPPQVQRRYARGSAGSDLAVWRFNNAAATLVAGKRLRIEVLAAARIRWSADGWAHTEEAETRPTHFGVHVADLPTARFARGTRLAFTFYWIEAGRWEGRDFTLAVVPPEVGRPADVHRRGEAAEPRRAAAE